MTTPRRVLSPHIQIYRPQLTSVLSITHRATGIILLCAYPFAVACLASLAWGQGELFLVPYMFLDSSMWGRVLLFFIAFDILFSLFFHLLNGIRHLMWDMGWGLSLGVATLSGWCVVVATMVLTVVAMRGVVLAYHAV
ncbi:MAG: succinate dehydrogenase, cytochrome b556 subunit [Alphaproteobacteria bacterium GM7ARS4]|nr:succinate dehydrogenase, cytochrome b556 subunit [Alphaproteobacteria bacterium GM7ARS4]